MNDRHKYFFDRLREMGLFVRDYDGVFVHWGRYLKPSPRALGSTSLSE